MAVANTNEANTNLLQRLIADWEGEVVEFKEASKDFDTDRIGKYVSALCNEANLAGADAGWLIFGVKNKTREVVGTDYRVEHDRLNSLKQQLEDGTEPSLTLRSIRVLNHAKGRVILFEVPPSPQGMPISWKGHFYGRAGESLVSLDLGKIDAIRAESSTLDWTGEVAEDASVDDLSPEAIEKARSAFIQRNAQRLSPEEVREWSDEKFLGHVGLLAKRGLTRAALLLLGKPESSYLLNPLMAELTWRLVGQESAY